MASRAEPAGIPSEVISSRIVHNPPLDSVVKRAYGSGVTTEERMVTLAPAPAPQKPRKPTRPVTLADVDRLIAAAIRNGGGK